MTVLGIETSCDETAAAVVTGDGRILANLVLSQLDEHRPYGGVVPEIAARSHLDHIDRLVEEAMAEAGLEFGALDGIAVTAGPGLIGGVFVGVMTAKAIALAWDLPFLAVNHLEGHALTARLGTDLAFPYLLLLVSGGHCQLLAVEGVGCYSRLGGTIDDAVGEAFDKTAKLLGLGYPGGPAVERAAADGDPAAFALPRPMIGRPGLDFSFSGLKTAVRHAAQAADLLDDPPGDAGNDAGRKADLAAAFQEAVGDILAERCGKALDLFRERYGKAGPLVVAGGVAANRHLRERLDGVARAAGSELMAPPPALCTDNAAMIAWAGVERLRLGLTDPLDFAARPRWPLEELRETPAPAKTG
ncbi:tRNA (adenosine(37)-N6)-threonylcarbamoyltransferase complex transferase subunit TsaD [Pelagibius litoralis]|uniref:tRNA N6-adenosine threonylcarbamoyltransferase n=1 Tax=Pelagibius litoralis TaxID=374515 RepID=A0A967F0X7_9PROT|nr:tRNA (adenosine(37)-N6)-threonylcarbamoyltransferase complex transferase subunit TsaD [Pelagibius litoralis]NIA71045.1 tRNA (adenosine(37)-N6)-threonylcarbamoyltransferase complex transferase subunit TsaD [Pelagibius litoralis]